MGKASSRPTGPSCGLTPTTTRSNLSYDTASLSNWSPSATHHYRHSEQQLRKLPPGHPSQKVHGSCKATPPAVTMRLCPPKPNPHHTSANFPAKHKLPRNATSVNPCDSARRRLSVALPKASPSSGDVVSGDGDDGVSLGTMKLPSDTDLARFELLLFQWANSLCQGATLPLPVPLKVDRVKGGARLGFVNMGDGEVEVPVYIDCLVFPADGGSGPMFRAIRNGPLKDKVAPGEERIMRSLLQALRTSVEIARVY